MNPNTPRSDSDPSTPHAFPRRILLAVTGLSPQVLTETLYALAVEGNPPFIPTEIHLITTAQGKEHARLNLLSNDPGWFHRLRAEYDLPAIGFDADHIHTIGDRAGAPLADIRTPEENELAADFINRKMAELCADPDAAIHVSLAGGRKTMGYYLGYALSLFGRPQDRLSHVLVSAPFESHPRFFYPTRAECVIHTLDREQRPLDCRDAKVTLAAIPFVRLREGLPPRLLDGEATLTEVVAAANRAMLPQRLVLDPRTMSVTANEQTVKLSPTEFILLFWFATRACSDSREIVWTRGNDAREFVAVAKRLYPDGFDALRKSVEERCEDPKLLGDYFEPHKSRIGAAFHDALGPVAAKRYAISRTGSRGRSRYFLPLSPDQIEIIN